VVAVVVSGANLRALFAQEPPTEGGEVPAGAAGASQPDRQVEPPADAAGANQPGRQVEPPVPGEPGEGEAAPPAVAEEGEGKEQEEGGLANGLRGVLKLLTNEGEKKPEAGAGDSSFGDEPQGKVVDLMRTASLNISKDRVADAMRNINDLIGLKPYDPDFHFALALCYRKLGKQQEALKKYQDVLDLGGPKALVSVLKAEVYAIEGDEENTFKFLREAAMGGRNIILDVGMLPNLRKYKEDTEFIKLALQLEKFEVSPLRKHDPFTNPFPRASAEPVAKGAEGEGQPASLTPEEQDKLLKEAKKAYARVQFYIKLEDETKAMKAYTKLRSVLDQRELVTIPKIANEFRFLINQMEDVEVQIEGIRLKFYYNQAQAKLKSMKENFTDGEYKRVEAIHAEIVDLTTEMSKANEQYKPVAERVLEAAAQWLHRAQVRQEFEGRKPKIQGVVISEEGKMAVVNDRVLKQGEALDDFRVVKVESNKVTFRYKGEEIPLVFRRY
jgi:tetratricopeptide (TPR) repeat protein